ncbi:MAG: preprotein translocase subunit SecY [Oscillospiraceae bacterium]|nr:preprotein translocase subunit SecY [Oscillospiraceae bacterium]
MLETIRNAWKIPDLRRRITFTLLMLVVFRFGAHIPVPYLSADAMRAFLGQGENGMDLFNLFDTFTGGAFQNATVLAMGVSPYINASIIIQLLAVAIPSLERLSKEGLEGRKKLNKITRYLGIVLAFVQGAGLYVTLWNMNAQGQHAIVNPSFLTFMVIVLTFTAGTAFIVWIGEQITEKGLGNGVSMIIFAGIITRIPTAAVSIYNTYVMKGGTFSPMGTVWAAVIVAIAIAAIALVVFFTNAERRIAVQYAKRVVGRKMYGGQSTNIPIKVAAGGVMPIIFASSIMAFPGTIVRLLKGGQVPGTGFGGTILNCLSSTGPIWTTVVYGVLYFLLIIFFTYFYSTIQFNPIEMSNNIKKSGGYIPGIRPGRPTSDFISRITSRLNMIGSLFLGIVAVLPIIIGAVTGNNGIQIGGTSLLIMVGVALETVQQIESQMVMRHYKGFLE